MAAGGGEVRTDRREDGILVVTIDHPPANALTPGLRGALMQALAEAAESGARGVVLCGAGRNFSAATAIDGDEGQPTLAELCQTIENLGVPVIAALRGAAVGPGAEVALACHGRVAQEDARIVLPEVGLGLTPAGGTTQRLPRILGAAEALAMLLKARPMPADEALALGLVDRIVEADPLPAAVAQALAKPVPKRSRDRVEGLADFAANQAAITAARAEAARGILPAPPRIIDCVEAALVLPFENGLAMEQVAREDLAETAESQGLIAAAQAERRAAVLPPAVARIVPKHVAILGLQGHAPQLAPLALIALAHGLQLRWADPDAVRRAEVQRWIDARLEAEVRAGRLTAAQRDADRARFAQYDDPQALTAADLILHAGTGAALTALQRQCPSIPHLVLGGAEGQTGLSLAPSARIAELALPVEGVSPDRIAVIVQMLRRLGIVPLLTGKMPILGRRVTAAGRAALAKCLAMGVPRRVLAAALDSFGQALPDLPEPETTVPMREMAEDEVLRRWQGAMANEGFRMLDALVARRPSDIDLVLIAGHGFPRWRGGPMHHAATRGLMVLRRDLRLWAKDDAEIWGPHPLLDRMISEGRRLSDLDRP